MLNMVQLSNEELIANLKNMTAKFIEDSFAFIINGSAIVRVLIDRGIDVAGIDCPFIVRLREVAEGRLLPELATFHEDIYDVAKKLPLSDQKKIAKSEELTVVDFDSLDVSNCRRVKPCNLTPTDAKVLFSRDGIRTPEQQIKWVINQRQKKALSKSAPTADWAVDRKNKHIVIGDRRFSRKQLLEMVAAIPE